MYQTSEHVIIATSCCVVWGNFRKLMPILTSRYMYLFPKVCSRVCVACIPSAMLHGSKLWDLTPLDLERLHYIDHIPWICYERSFSAFYLYMKPIIFSQRLQLFVQSPQPYLLIFAWRNSMCFTNIFVKKKPKWISEFHRTSPQELKCWSTFYVNHFLRYYLMMQHQPIVKRVNGTHEWAHRPYQPLSASYHCCLYKHRRLDERQPPQTSWPVPICT